MTDKKALTWFLVITFAVSWPLFLIPLLLRDLDPTTAQLATQGLWALAMWGPGIAAILTTGSGIQVSDVVRNGIPHTRNLAGFHPAPRKS